MKVLIIEDSAEVVEAVTLCIQLRWPDANIATVAEGGRGLEILKSEPIDIVILDINLPDLNGFEILQRMRQFSNVPTIILTVRGREEDQTRGLEMGADDYIVKPFRPRDLVARVNAVLRRSISTVPGQETPFVTRGKLTLNITSNEVHFRNGAVKLTPTETKLLFVLMGNADATISGGKLAEEVWGKSMEITDPVRTYVKRLRNKLGDNPPQIILTEYGEGYKFVTPL